MDANRVVSTPGSDPPLRAEGQTRHVPGMPLQDAQWLRTCALCDGRAIPDPDPHIQVPAPAGQEKAVRTKGHAADMGRVVAEGQRLLSAEGIPQPHRLILTARCEAPAIRRKSNRGNV